MTETMFSSLSLSLWSGGHGQEDGISTCVDQGVSALHLKENLSHSAELTSLKVHAESKTFHKV